MKFKLEKNLKILNELISYFHKHGADNLHIDIENTEDTFYCIICGSVPNLKERQLEKLDKILNCPRQHEVEQYYWNLNGESELDGELTLVGMMIDKVEISYENSVLELKVWRS